MNFQEVLAIARYYKFRSPNDGEDETVYRRALSQHLYAAGHVIEAHEVVTGRWETSEETKHGLRGAATRALDGRLPGDVEIDRAVDEMARENKDDGLADALLAAFKFGINPLDLLGK